LKKPKKFICYICNQQTLTKRKGLEVGSGKFTHAICKLCSRENYAIHEDSYFEEHEEMRREDIPKEFDEEEIIMNQIKFMKMAKEILERAGHNE